jgi:TolB protein
VVTSGTDLDSDGYTAHVLREGASIASLALSINGSVTSPSIGTDTYQLMLETAENCTVASGATRQAVVTDGATNAIAFDVTCTPPGELAFVRNEQIFLARTNGTGLVKLTSTGHNADPAWSPDGTRIAFASDRGGRWDIYVMNPDGSGIVPLTNTGHNVEPSWSPDGQRIAFTTVRSGSADVYTVSVFGDGSSATPLVTHRGYDGEPAWSPGGKIAFVSDWRAYDFLYDVYLVNADGSDITPLLNGPFFWVDTLKFYFQPAWSPDGSRLAVNVCGYAWDNCFPASTVMVANADGSGLTALAAGGGYSNPTWSPDAGTLAFSRSTCRSCATSLNYVRVDGTQEGAILLNGHSPSWRPSP